MKNAFMGFSLCMLILLGTAGGFYFGKQAGNTEGYAEGYDFGYKIGQTPTNEDVNAENTRMNAIQDLATISDGYRQMSDMCEEKYQLGIEGNIVDALEVKGRMTEIQNRIDQIMSSYEDSTDTNAL